MANCHQEFQTYLEAIRLTTNRRGSLKDVRDTNRKRVKAYFRDQLNREAPLFYGQGSYGMHTNVNPLDGEFDIDDGVYLQGLGTDSSKWPTSDTVHGWLVDATTGFTKEPPENKPRCVRVRYSGNYHLDLPAYALNAQGVPLIFERGKEPYESDPRGFSSWFGEQLKSQGEQLRPVVRYLKGWRDYQGGDASVASGLALTILAAERFVANDRDDVAFVRVVEAMHAYLEAGATIHKPVTPYEDLSAFWSQTQRTGFIAKLKNLRDRGRDALDEDDKAVASDIWRKLLGDRFPKIESDDDGDGSIPPATPIKTSAPAILPNQPARSA